MRLRNSLRTLDSDSGIGTDDITLSDIHELPHKTFKYEKLHNSDSGYSDLQYASPLPSPIPWKAIVLAFGLFVFGSILILFSVALLLGIFGEQYEDRKWPLMLLGVLMFIPGAYHVRIAYYAYIGEAGYSFDDIPDFDQ
uniref:Transmembrane protein 230 n=1 Tax=Acrobeloides nanus TaxID=290746 RepID=A0A914C2M9_9BILA